LSSSYSHVECHFALVRQNLSGCQCHLDLFVGRSSSDRMWRVEEWRCSSTDSSLRHCRKLQDPAALPRGRNSSNRASWALDAVGGSHCATAPSGNCTQFPLLSILWPTHIQTRIPDFNPILFPCCFNDTAGM
jgi:hypothetical protein